ncbi:antitoxin [Brenneria roseae subsp. roseae]|uniref:type II toxin-antitoxin system HicB family antitoxin n=1 Tax=Brenneria roseae TaxID=1509241 RepID=UPI000D60B8E4|nr:type II toxin-antitoxin system HicB family antitoxin [Brenneria roseae]PWC17144.1 antitoxin [Brenneria roseae subsp. roseae]
MRYPVNLELDPDLGGYMVSFPDIPKALTQDDTRKEALAMALDALVTSFDFYFEDNQRVPLLGEITGDYVEVPASVAAKVLMLNAFIDSGLTQVELASRMGVKKQEVTRLFDLHHSTKIDTIQKALTLLGKRLELVAA